MIDSGSETGFQDSDMNIDPTPDSTLDMVPSKKARGPPKAGLTKVSKPKTTSRSTADATRAVRKSSAVPKVTSKQRAVLQERRNGRNASEVDDEEVPDELDESRMGQEQTAPSDDDLQSPVAVPEPARRGRATKKTATQAGPDRVKVSTGSSTQTVATKRPAKASSTSKKASSREKHAPKNPPPVSDVEDATLPPEEETVEEPGRRAGAAHTSRARSVSKSRLPSVPRKRAGSFSDAERGAAGNDPAVRRKLGEMTRKLENLDLKYRNLRDIGVKEAEVNFDRLRQQSEEKGEAASVLIASLKKGVQTQSNLAKESRSLRKQLDARDAEVTELQSRLVELEASVAEARGENKTLAAKLSASRNATPSLSDSRKVGAGGKSHDGSRPMVMGSAEVAQAAQTAQLKEDLYSDLTGLLIRGVKRDADADADVFDCIQTGRNGTLRFKLSIAKHSHAQDREKGGASSSSSSSSYENTEFVFTPLFDSKHDADLMELLPDYLTEEITFARGNASKFYARVVKTLTQSA
ncbi:MAG: hypothetical protein M1838_001061 [Thelocarpon superellum]|nr:MAG: hypothetical protein M1838_001061 [Thelocarpon superellum]